MYFFLNQKIIKYLVFGLLLTSGDMKIPPPLPAY